MIASLCSRYLDNPTILLIYFVIRTVSIIINIFAILIIFYKIYKLSLKDPSFQANSNPVYILSMRLVYYCLVQTITRIGSSWYQLQYGFGSAADYDSDNASTLKTIIYLSEFVLTPSAGIGYLIVFLRIQPDAWKELKRMLNCFKEGAPRQIMKVDKVVSYNDNSTISPLIDDQDESVSDLSSKYYVLSTTDYDPHNSLRYVLENEADEDENNDGRGSSSTRESLFPLLEMDEADLAREIDRIYVNQPYL